jgi:hypothetical protein
MPCVPQDAKPAAATPAAGSRARIFGWSGRVLIPGGIYRLAFVRLLLPAAIAPLLLAGCGTSPAVRTTDHELDLTLAEYRIAPQAASVPAGRLRIVAHNQGILTHNVELERGTLDSSERTVLATIHTLLPGRSGTVLTGPLRPGRYLLVSAVGNQTTLGMAATLIVR